MLFVSPLNKSEIAKRFFDKYFFEHNLKRYKSYVRKDDFYDTDEYYNIELENFEEIEWGNLNPECQHLDEAIYLSTAMDGIACRIYKVQIKNFITITYRITTDGDDGWLVVFSDCGELLAAGNTLGEVIEWASDSFLESCDTHTVDMLTFEGKNMSDRTFWGKPLEEVEVIEKQRYEEYK